MSDFNSVIPTLQTRTPAEGRELAIKIARKPLLRCNQIVTFDSSSDPLMRKMQNYFFKQDKWLQQSFRPSL